MSYKLYDPKKSYYFPNGEMADNQRVLRDFPFSDRLPYAIEEHDGIIREMTLLSVLAESYGVEGTEPDYVISEINRINAQISPNIVQLSDVQKQLNAIAGGDLGTGNTTALAQLRTAATMFVQAQAASLADVDAMAVSTLFAEWAAGSDYKTGEVVRYGGNLYRLLQNVTGAQAEHTPDVATSLYKRVGEPDPSGVWPWVQPLGATDAYKAGDKVSHNGKVWVSTVDNNVWEPGVYGWDESE